MFNKKTWKDRISEYPTRRLLVDEEGNESVVTLIRNEGQVMQEGDPFNEETMNDLEERIEAAFEYAEFLLSAGNWVTNIDSVSSKRYPYTYTISTSLFGAVSHDCEVYGAAGINSKTLPTEAEEVAMSLLNKVVVFNENSIVLYATERPTANLTFYVYG